MGAGRFFALLAVLAALPAPVVASSSALLQAQSVSPYVALSQGDGVELRDAQNRPISRAALARELRAGAAAEAEPVSSRAARFLAEFLERMSAPVSAARSGASGTEHRPVAAAGAPREPKARFVRVFTPAPLTGPAAVPAEPDTAPRTSLGRAFNLPLRI